MWDEAAALAEQERLRALVRTESAPGLRLDGAVAGADVAYDDAAGVCAGVAKNPLAFAYGEPGEERGAWAPLTDGEAGGEVVGRALRTRDGVKPVFVSSGRLVGLDDACALTLRLTPRYRLPETTRLADRLCRDALAAAR